MASRTQTKQKETVGIVAAPADFIDWMLTAGTRFTRHVDSKKKY